MSEGPSSPAPAFDFPTRRTLEQIGLQGKLDKQPTLPQAQRQTQWTSTWNTQREQIDCGLKLRANI